jgi:beta-lactamase class A
LRRRSVLLGGLGGLGLVLAGCSAAAPPPSPGPSGEVARPTATFAERITSIEARFGGRLGVAALDTATGTTVGHRTDERFLMLSMVKVPITAAILRRSGTEPGLLDRRLHWTAHDLVPGASSATSSALALADGMTVAELCAAAVTVSDSTAANLLIAQLGGPPSTTAFLRSLGDDTSRADRTEPTLNDPAGDLDTSTPRAFLGTLRTLTLGAALAPAARGQLVGWMRANTTGDAQIRAGTPTGWAVADKTGSGHAGQANDAAAIWPPARPPLLLVVFTAPTDANNPTGRATIARITREVLHAFDLPGR